MLRSQKGSNPFHLCHDNLSDQDQARQQRDEGDGGCASKVSHTERGFRGRGVSSTASNLEAVPIPRKENAEGKCDGKR